MIYASVQQAEDARAKYEIKGLPYAFGCISSLKDLVIFTYEMKCDLCCLLIKINRNLNVYVLIL
jgi:hypothetical protein